MLVDSAGSLRSPTSIPVSGETDAVAISDLNGDGHNDLVVGAANEATITVLLGHGDGTFDGEPGSYGTPTTSPGPYTNHIRFFALGNLDGDSNPDLVTANGPAPGADPATISIFKGNGDGSFTHVTDYGVGNTYQEASRVRVTDLNDDGKMDIVSADENCGGVAEGHQIGVFLGDGTDHFTAQGERFGQCVWGMTTADLNGDGSPDIVIARHAGVFNNESLLEVALGKGDGTFEPFLASPVPASAGQLTVADFTGDGNLDAAVASSTGDVASGSSGHGAEIAFASGKGDGTFNTAEALPLTNNPGQVTYGDLNGDESAPDLITNEDSQITVFPNTGPAAPHALEVSVGGSGSGSITGVGIDCPGTCKHSYPSGTTVTLTATPGLDSSFTGWSGTCSGTGSCSVSLSSDQKVGASFTEQSGDIGPPTPTCAEHTRQVGPFTLDAACFVARGGKLVARGRVRVNGVDIVPDGSGSITIDPRALTLSASGEVKVYLGSTEVYHHSLSWRLQGNPTLAVAGGVKIKGLTISGELVLAPSKAKGGLMDITANAKVGSITGDLQLELTNALGLQINDATLSWAGGLPLKQILVKSASLSYHRGSAGDEWTGRVSVELPAKLPTLAGKLAILNGQIAEVGLTASKINKPIGEIVYLQELGLDVRVVPHIKATGELELSAGPTLPLVNAPAASLQGSLTADFGSPVVLSATGKIVVAGKLNLANAKAKWTVPSRFELSGEAKISVGPASVDAKVSGIVASNGFALFGNGSVSIPGAQGNGIVYFSEKGFGACVMESVGPVTVAEGFGTHWQLQVPDLWFDSCGLESYKSKAGAASVSRARSSAGGESIQVPAGQQQVLIGARGVSDFPAFSVESPSGQVVDPANGVSGPVDAGGYRFVSDPPHLGTYVILARPEAGTWRILPAPGTPQIASFGSALGAPTIGVKAHVHKSKSGYLLSWRATDVAGEKIRFTEVSPLSARALKTTPTASGTLRFEPTGGGSGGRRTIEALVSVDGLPRKVRTVATFRVPQQPTPRIRGLRIDRRGREALIHWKPSHSGALDLRISLSDGRRLFFRLPAGARQQRVPLLPTTTRVSATLRTFTAAGQTGPRTRATARL